MANHDGIGNMFATQLTWWRMTNGSRDTFRKQLELLLSMHREELGDKVLAEVLFAAANGLVALLRDAGRYDPDDRVVELRFTDASHLEGQLEDLLTTKVICVRVDRPVPTHEDMTIRITCGSEHVDLNGRAVQITQAGTVFQLAAAGVDVQRALVGLPAILRSNPIEALVIDQKSVHLPEFVNAEAAREALFGAPEPAPPAARPQTMKARPLKLEREEFLEPSEPSEPSLADEATAAGEDRVAASRLAFQLPRVDGVLARATSKSHFEFLNVHFSADIGVIEAARQELLVLIEQCRRDDVNGEATDRLDALVSRLNAAWNVLSNTKSRRAHRREVVPQFQVETALEMYERQAEAAKMSRRYEVAIDCYRSIVELDPTDDQARVQLDALRSLDT